MSKNKKFSLKKIIIKIVSKLQSYSLYIIIVAVTITATGSSWATGF